MEQILKYIWVIKTLHRAGRRGISLADLNEKWRNHTDLSRGEEMPRQTFNRWKNELEEMFGVMIECERKGGYRYYITNPEVLEKGGLSGWLLDTYSTAGALSNRMSLKDRILVEDVPSSHDFLEDIIDAMQNNRVVSVTYRGFNKDESHTFDVEPYCVKMAMRRWYLLGRSPYYDKVMVYGLDRIENLSIEKKQFKLPKDFDAESYFSSYFGVILKDDVKEERVLIRADRYNQHYLRSLPLHHTQREVYTCDDYADFELCLRPTYDFCMELLKYGASIEILEPQSLRHRMHGEARDLWGMYKKD